ncbi:hypothetical protein [Massilia sp. PWRC2]|uniref:hypothetical protein n=1 Tax=Massilia sp. PWRC2 TaxID=2804626 RepID=UPI003CF2A83D
MKSDTLTQPTLPMGKNKGQPISAMRTQYLLWLLTQENIRSKYRSAVDSILAEIRTRLAKPGLVEAELAAGVDDLV